MFFPEGGKKSSPREKKKKKEKKRKIARDVTRNIFRPAKKKNTTGSFDSLSEIPDLSTRWMEMKYKVRNAIGNGEHSFLFSPSPL